jgi:hypothetical protein
MISGSPDYTTLVQKDTHTHTHTHTHCQTDVYKGQSHIVKVRAM